MHPRSSSTELPTLVSHQKELPELTQTAQSPDSSNPGSAKCERASTIRASSHAQRALDSAGSSWFADSKSSLPRLHPAANPGQAVM